MPSTFQEVEMAIVDPETHHSRDRRTQGLILARGPNIFSGYASEAPDPFLTLDGRRWYNTGDLGFFDREGALHIAGGLSRAVKIGGELISLPSVEEALLNALKIPGLQLAVIGTEEGKLILFTNREIDPNPVLRQAVVQQPGENRRGPGSGGASSAPQRKTKHPRLARAGSVVKVYIFFQIEYIYLICALNFITCFFST